VLAQWKPSRAFCTHRPYRPYCLQVTTEPQLVQRSEAFEAAIRGGDREALAAFCADMEQRVGGGRGGEGPAGGEVWSAQQQGGGGGGV
jgi:hypothetical protein